MTAYVPTYLHDGHRLILAYTGQLCDTREEAHEVAMAMFLDRVVTGLTGLEIREFVRDGETLPGLTNIPAKVGVYDVLLIEGPLIEEALAVQSAEGSK